MRTILLGALTAGLVLTTTGCAHNVIGAGVTRVDQYFGDVGVLGSGANVTILRGSKVTKLSLLGNSNSVTVQDGVTLYQIEFWGKGNTVSIPEPMVVRTTEVGTNQVIRRPRDLRGPSEWSRFEDTDMYVPPPAEPVPDTGSEQAPQEDEDTTGETAQPEDEAIEATPTPPVKSEAQ